MKKINKQKSDIIKILDELILRNKKIIGFGASGRTTFLNFKIKKYINYIIDGSPLRAGKFIPGLKIPIKNLDYLKKMLIILIMF